MKGLAIAVAVSLSMSASADFLTRDSGEVITIPDGYNTGPYHARYNLQGMSAEGTFPGKALVDAFIFQLSLVDFPDEEDCTGLVIAPTVRDPRCKVYRD
jgi:hypothetical protein